MKAGNSPERTGASSSVGRQFHSTDCIVAVAATIGGAVAAALASFGVEPNELPFMPSRIWRLIEEAKTRLSTR